MERAGTRRFSKTPFDLTERQIEVIRLIELGYSNSEIATQLGISLDGAKFHVSEILAKLEVSSREEAAVIEGGSLGA
ncbi:MAG: LuxR C-terminal-related transcriptional regulator [Dehalococcoidia bacterium]